MRLLVAIPAGDLVPVPFLQSLVRLAQQLERDGVPYEVAIESGSLVYMARDRLARKAMAEKFTHVLWLDSDMVFEPSIVEDLQFCGQDFVTGIACGRRKPFCSPLYKDIRLEYLTRWQRKDYPSEPFEVAGCGFACVLIKTDILQAVIRKYNTAFTPFVQYGEDIAFCKRCAELGIKIYADPHVKLGHIGHIELWPDDCERYLDEIH